MGSLFSWKGPHIVNRGTHFWGSPFYHDTGVGRDFQGHPDRQLAGSSQMFLGAWQSSSETSARSHLWRSQIICAYSANEKSRDRKLNPEVNHLNRSVCQLPRYFCWRKPAVGLLPTSRTLSQVQTTVVLQCGKRNLGIPSRRWHRRWSTNLLSRSLSDSLWERTTHSLFNIEADHAWPDHTWVPNELPAVPSSYWFGKVVKRIFLPSRTRVLGVIKPVAIPMVTRWLKMVPVYWGVQRWWLPSTYTIKDLRIAALFTTKVVTRWTFL